VFSGEDTHTSRTISWDIRLRSALISSWQQVERLPEGSAVGGEDDAAHFWRRVSSDSLVCDSLQQLGFAIGAIGVVDAFSRSQIEREDAWARGGRPTRSPEGAVGDVAQLQWGVLVVVTLDMMSGV